MVEQPAETTCAVIVAGGKGIRLGHSLPKPFVPIAGRSMVAYSLETFEKHPFIDLIVLVCGEGWENEADELGRKYAATKLHRVVQGGLERPDSVRAGLEALPESCTRVAIHDAARPFVSEEIITVCITALNSYDGSVPGMPVSDTLRRTSDNLSSGTIDRSDCILTQTPQCFNLPVLLKALEQAAKDGFSGTDDVSYVERIKGTRVTIVPGAASNFKVTTSEDLYRAEAMVNNNVQAEYRCGEGFDAHRYTTGRDLILGGVKVPFDLGLHGHSDADVLCHAIGDALLGAVALGDLGVHFPDTDPQYEGVSSIELLKEIKGMISVKGYQIINIDATLILQYPKIAPYRESMRENIALTLSLPLDMVSVKATTTEGMGPFGRGEGIACRAVVMLAKIP